MIKSFGQAVKFLENHIPAPDKKHPGELGLARMRNLMELLGNPQLEYPTIHVGGTSGKGSTTTFIASILATKYKVGLHTSPHLVRINERIKIFSRGPLAEIARGPLMNDENITDAEFINLVNYVRPFVEKAEKSRLGIPSYFEIVSAMAFVYFYRKKVDIAVIEVGMGGRYDATNVINPLVAVITNVGLDHTEILGDTVEKIAGDKAGIIKLGIQVVSGVRKTSIIRIIEVQRRKQSAKLSLLNREFSYKIKKINSQGSVFDYKGDKLLKDLKIKLLGEHQVENAVLAIRAVELLNNPINSQIINEEDIRNGLKRAFIPGRLEMVGRKPLVILDGAHNPDKVKALAAAVKNIFPGKKITAIVAIKADKNANKMVAMLLKISKMMIFTRFRLTGDLGVIKSYSPQKLLKLTRLIYPDKPVMTAGNVRQAVKDAEKNIAPGDVVLITGSLYLVGEVRKFLIKN